MIRRRLVFALTLLALSMAAARVQAGSTEVQVSCIHDKPFRVSVAQALDPHLLLAFCGTNNTAKEMSYQKADLHLRPSKDPAATRLNAGEYAYVDPWVAGIATQTPPSSKQPKVVNAELLVFSSQWLNTAEIVLVMQRDGLTPATLDNLITLGVERPELQEQYHIVALGTAAINPEEPTVAVFPVLGAVDGERYLTRIEATRDETLWPYNLRLFASPALLAKMGGEHIPALELAYGETPAMQFAFLAVPTDKTKPLLLQSP